MKTTIKKGICAALIFTMLLALAPMTAFAIGVSQNIQAGVMKTITVDAEEDSRTYLSFAPTETAEYTLFSISDGFDPFVSILDKDDNELDYNDDGNFGENEYDFFLKYEFTAGEKYYFAIGTYDGDAVDISIMLTKVCESHFDDDGDYRCDACFDLNLPDDISDLLLDRETLVEASPNGEYFKFTAEEDGMYVFSSSCEFGDPKIILYDEDYNKIQSQDDGPSGRDFHMSLDLYEGDTLYVFVKNSDEDADTTFKVILCTDHIDETLDGNCDICYIFTGVVKQEITVWEELTFPSSPATTYIKFEPKKTGSYTMISKVTEDYYSLFAILRDEDFAVLTYSTSVSEEDGNFTLTYEFEAGKTYYFEIKDYLPSGNDEVIVELTLDGEERPAETTKKPNKGSSSKKNKDDEDVANTTTTAADEEKGGCGSTLAISSLVMIPTLAGGVILTSKKRKENDLD